MKRLASLAIVVVLFSFPASAQSDPWLESVLGTARDMFSSSDSSGQSESESAEEEGKEEESGDEEDGLGFALINIQFVPALGWPFGIWNVGVGVGVVGFVGGDVSIAAAGSVFAFADDVSGALAAGVIAIADDVSGAIAAGVISVADDVEGFQAAGVVNIAGSVAGAQLAGVVNVAGDVSGAQVAGVVNIAGRVDGVMIGLVNIAESVDGVAIGLVNIIEEGMQDWWISWDAATGHATLGYQTGTDDLYALFYGSLPSADLFTRATRMVIGAGLGVRVYESEGSWLDVDLSAEQVAGESVEAFFSNLVATNPVQVIRAFSPFPVLRISAGIELLGFAQAFVGIRLGIDLGIDDNYPPEMRGGSGWSATLFDIPFTAYPSIFFGLKI